MSELTIERIMKEYFEIRHELLKGSATYKSFIRFLKYLGYFFDEMVYEFIGIEWDLGSILIKQDDKPILLAQFRDRRRAVTFLKFYRVGVTSLLSI